MYFLLSRSISLICKSCDAGPCLFFFCDFGAIVYWPVDLEKKL